jgi:hypothetical protein
MIPRSKMQPPKAKASPGYRAPASAPADARRAAGTALGGDGSVAPRVDCMTTRVVMAAHQDSWNPNQRATKSETTAATAVRAERSMVSGLSLPMIEASIDPVVQRTRRSTTITQSTAGR